MGRRKITTNVDDMLYQDIELLRKKYGSKKVIKKLIERGFRKPQCKFLYSFEKTTGECKLFGTISLHECVFCPFFTKWNEKPK